MHFGKDEPGIDANGGNLGVKVIGEGGDHVIGTLVELMIISIKIFTDILLVFVSLG